MSSSDEEYESSISDVESDIPDIDDICDDIFGGDIDDIPSDEDLGSTSEEYTSSEEESSTDDEEDYYTDEEEQVDKKLTKLEQSKLGTNERVGYYVKTLYSKYLNKLPKEKKSTVHNNYKIVPNDERITSNTMSIYEVAELISIRSKHIEEGAEVFTPIEYQSKTSSSIEKATEEFRHRCTPLLLLRPVKNNIEYEVWDPKTMDFPDELSFD